MKKQVIITTLGLMLVIAAAAIFSKKTYQVERVIAAPSEAI